MYKKTSFEFCKVFSLPPVINGWITLYVEPGFLAGILACQHKSSTHDVVFFCKKSPHQNHPEGGFLHRFLAPTCFETFTRIFSRHQTVSTPSSMRWSPLDRSARSPRRRSRVTSGIRTFPLYIPSPARVQLPPPWGDRSFDFTKGLWCFLPSFCAYPSPTRIPWGKSFFLCRFGWRCTRLGWWTLTPPSPKKNTIQSASFSPNSKW